MQEYRLIVFVDSEPEPFGTHRFRDVRAAQSRVAAAVRYFSEVGDVSAVELQRRCPADEPEPDWRRLKSWGADVVARILAEDAVAESTPMPSAFAAAGGLLVERRVESSAVDAPGVLVSRSALGVTGGNGSNGSAAAHVSNGQSNGHHAAAGNGVSPARALSARVGSQPEPSRHRSARRALAVAASCVAMAVLVLLWLQHDGRAMEALANATRGDRLRQLPFEATAFQKPQASGEKAVTSAGGSLFGDE